MIKSKQTRCYICYEQTNNSSQYHPACIKKLFNSEFLPQLAISEQDITRMALKYIKEKKGLPGVQKKLSLSLIADGEKGQRLTIVGYLGGEYILKPPTDKYPLMPEIEDLTMHLAKIAKITVPPHGLMKLQDEKLAYIVKRFDRNGKKKIAVEDLCQLSLKMTEDKYKSSSEITGKIIKKYSSNPGDDALKFFELILFSLLTGNADMHLKNFSLITQDLNNIKLSPCYDLLATKLLIPATVDSEELALSLNGKKSNFKKKDFILFGENLNISTKVIEYAMSSMIECLPKWEKKIEQSFLTLNLKQAFKQLIINNISRIN